MEDEEKEIHPPPRSLKATIWKHFRFYLQPGPGKKGLDMTHAICRDWNGKVKYFGSTSNPRSHLERHQPELLVEFTWIKKNRIVTPRIDSKSNRGNPKDSQPYTLSQTRYKFITY